MMAIPGRISDPDDVAVVVGRHPAARLAFPSLTTINQHQRQMGQRAAEMLFERIDERRNYRRSEQMPFDLVIREST
jgi:LacI family transcriptional regulator